TRWVNAVAGAGLCGLIVMGMLAAQEPPGAPGTQPSTSAPKSTPAAPAQTAPAATAPSGIAFEYDLSKALTLAKAQDKPLLVEFITNHCPYCARMQAKVYPDP